MDQTAVPEDWDLHFKAIWVELHHLLKESGAATAILLDATGNAVTYAGEDPDFDLSTFASLAVGDYVATQELASILGHGQSRWVVHQGIKGGMVLVPVHPLLILGVLFDSRTTLGLVRHEIRRAKDRLLVTVEPVLRLIEEQLARGESEDERPSPVAVGEAADRAVDQGLMELFGPAS